MKKIGIKNQPPKYLIVHGGYSGMTAEEMEEQARAILKATLKQED